MAERYALLDAKSQLFLCLFPIPSSADCPSISSISSSIPSYKTFCCHTARKFAIATTSHTITINTVAAEHTSLITGLFNAVPIHMVAMVNPAFGKMNAHQERSNFICGIPNNTDTVESAQNQTATSQRKMPAETPIAFQI